MKKFILFSVLVLMLTSQAFAARGVDYNGYGNPVTISDHATGLKVETGKSIFLGDGSTFLTGAGAVTLPGASTVQSMEVNPGNVTITAGDLLITAGDITQTLGDNTMTAGNFTITLGDATLTDGDLTLSNGAISASDSITAGDGVTVDSGNVTITAGSILVTAGDITQTSGNHTITAGNITLTDGDLTITDATNKIAFGGVEFLTGSAATRSAVRADGGDAAPIGSVYFSTNGGATTAPKVYFKIANATADADWERLVTAAAD